VNAKQIMSEILTQSYSPFRKYAEVPYCFFYFQIRRGCAETQQKFKYAGVQSKNNAFHIVNNVQNQRVYERISCLIDVVVCVVFCFATRFLIPYEHST
jgi:hypothetical protein